MARKQRRGEDTAARLLDAARDVYASAGPEGFTVHAVVASSGISLGSLYHHFGSFDGLAAALYARCMGELLEALVIALEPTPPRRSPRSARAGITAVVRAYLAFTERHPTEAMFIHASAYASYLPEHGAAIAAVKAPRLERILAWLRPHVRAGTIVELPEPLVEMLVIGPAAEVTRRWLAKAPGIDITEASRLLPERVWRSLRAPRVAERVATRT